MNKLLGNVVRVARLSVILMFVFILPAHASLGDLVSKQAWSDPLIDVAKVSAGTMAVLGVLAIAGVNFAHEDVVLELLAGLLVGSLVSHYLTKPKSPTTNDTDTGATTPPLTNEQQLVHDVLTEKHLPQSPESAAQPPAPAASKGGGILLLNMLGPNNVPAYGTDPSGGATQPPTQSAGLLLLNQPSGNANTSLFSGGQVPESSNAIPIPKGPEFVERAVPPANYSACKPNALLDSFSSCPH